MTNQLPTYHGSPEDEGQLRLSQTVPEDPAPVPSASEIAPRRPDASNLQLNPDLAALEFKLEAEQEHRSFLERLTGIFAGGDEDWESELDRMIDRYPEAASNFVLRGEILLKKGQAERAKADFLHAYEISAERVVDERFGFVAQMTQDRALDGLKRTRAMLGE
ncbi:MAG: hypothetical protein U0452_15660 [Anaerolineae bacterium]